MSDTETAPRPHVTPVDAAARWKAAMDAAKLRESTFTSISGAPRKALYTLVTEQLSWPAFSTMAPTDRGPFGDHLRRQLWLLRDQPALRAALKQIIREERCDDRDARFRLVRAGLAQSSGEVCTCRNELYKVYFRERLD